MSSEQNFQCASSIAYDRFGCNSGFTPDVTFTYVIGQGDNSGTTYPLVEGSQGAIWAYSVQVRNIQTTSSSSSSSASPSTSTASLSPDSDTSNGLSGGIIAGIVIGVLAGLALSAIGMYLLFRRRGTNPSPPPASYQPHMMEKPGGMYQWSAGPPYQGQHGAQGQQYWHHELDSQQMASELPGQYAPPVQEAPSNESYMGNSSYAGTPQHGTPYLPQTSVYDSSSSGPQQYQHPHSYQGNPSR